MRSARRSLSFGLVLLAAAAPGRALLPAGFVDEPVAAVDSPTALAFLPDGRLLVTQQLGDLRIVTGGVLAPTPVLHLGPRLCTNRERGLDGVAVDPDWASNHFVYLYYTLNRTGICDTPDRGPATKPVNRVARFVLPAGSNVIDPQSEVVLVDNVLSMSGIHNAGDLHFGPDGYLYVTVGDEGCNFENPNACAGENDAARHLHSLAGKVLRITRDGGIPPDNPFRGDGTAPCARAGSVAPGTRCQEIFTSGLRNPFRMAIDPNSATPRFFVNDVGQDSYEEIDLGAPGADYGWNCREGAHPNPQSGPCTDAGALVDPLFEYAHDVPLPWSSGAGWPGGAAPTSCGAITGAAFVPNGAWPGFDGAYLWSDYVCGGIFALRPVPGNGAGWAASDFATDLGNSSAVDLEFGPAGGGQALYYTTYANGGEVRRIRYVGGGNRPPLAALRATPISGTVPLAVAFDGSSSVDPDGDPLTYLWSFGDGATARTSGPHVTHVYRQAGTPTARLQVRDSHRALSPAATLRVFPGDTAPQPHILAPAPSATFAVGETVHLAGGADDAEDGPIPPTGLLWRVLLHHNDHTHPLLGPLTGAATVDLVAPAPEDFAATARSYVEIQLTATDRQGLSATVAQRLEPRRVAVTLLTDPAGLALRLNGEDQTTPVDLTSWAGWGLRLAAPSPQTSGDQVYAFDSWSDGGAAAHTAVTPATASAYSARFAPVGDAALDLGGRLRVTVGWSTSTASGYGHPLPLSADSGLFWFFDPANVELLVKVVDGCALNGHRWVFAAGLTDVETEIAVRDLTGGGEVRYRHASGTPFDPVQDTAAFASCP